MRFFSIFLLILFATNISARDFRVFQIPNGTKYSCRNCHQTNFGGLLNVFGEQVLQVGLNGMDVDWSKLYDLDADGDGYTNGQELLDPNGEWRPGMPNPGTFADVTEVWNPNSFPVSSISWSNFISKPEVSPNPSSSNFNIRFEVKMPNNINIRIVDLKGNTISRIFNGFHSIGTATFSWNGTTTIGIPAPKGTYLIFIQMGNQFRTEKILLR